MSMSSLPPEIKNLSIADRIALAQFIWESIDEESLRLPITDSVKAELDRRLEDLENRPQQLETLETVVQRLLEK